MRDTQNTPQRQRLMTCWLGFATLLVACSGAAPIPVPKRYCAPISTPPSSESKLPENALNIVNGELAVKNDPMEKSTVALQTIYEISTFDNNGNPITGFKSGTCTAVVAAKNVLITAAHCFDVPTEKIISRRFGVLTLNDMKKAKSADFIGIKSFAQHPEWNGTYHDVAVVQLSKNLPEDILPAKFEFEEANLKPQTPVVLIGYGITADDGNDSGTKRRTESQLDKIINKENFPKTELVNQIRVLDLNPLPRGACRGDSGGPGFIKETSKVFGIVQGINSTVQPLVNMTCNAGDANYTLIAPYREWIEKTANITLSSESVGSISSTQSTRTQISDKLVPCQ